jgi:hypothetical protein
MQVYFVSHCLAAKEFGLPGIQSLADGGAFRDRLDELEQWRCDRDNS